MADKVRAVIDQAARALSPSSDVGTDPAGGSQIVDADLSSQPSHRRRITELESRASIDRHVITALVERGVEAEQQVAHLKLALSSARLIGMAVGVIMETQNVDERQAFELLSAASHTLERKVRDVAQDVVGGRRPAG